jgi:hypothetical protein
MNSSIEFLEVNNKRFNLLETFLWVDLFFFKFLCFAYVASKHSVEIFSPFSISVGL